jgi:predicted DNA binding CopG/RHH family protein
MKSGLPKFRNETKERAFWARHDSTDFIDWKKSGKVVLPKLKPSLKTISIRLPEMMLEELKVLANKRDIPYQSLVKMFLAERLKDELEPSSSK